MEFNELGTLGVIWDVGTVSLTSVPLGYEIVLCGDQVRSLTEVLGKHPILHLLDLLASSQGRSAVSMSLCLGVNATRSQIMAVKVNEFVLCDCHDAFDVLRDVTEASTDTLCAALTDADVPQEMAHEVLCIASGLHCLCRQTGTIKEIAAKLGLSTKIIEEWVSDGTSKVHAIASGLWDATLARLIAVVNHHYGGGSFDSVNVTVVPTFAPRPPPAQDIPQRLRNVIMRHRPWQSEDLTSLLGLPTEAQRNILTGLVRVFGVSAMDPIPLQQYVDASEFHDLPFPQQLKAFYLVYDAGRLKNIYNELEAFRYREDELFQELQKQYKSSYIDAHRFCRAIYWENRAYLSRKMTETQFVTEQLQEYKHHEFRLCVVLMKRDKLKCGLPSYFLLEHMGAEEYVLLRNPTLKKKDVRLMNGDSYVHDYAREVAVNSPCAPRDGLLLLGNLLCDMSLKCAVPTIDDAISAVPVGTMLTTLKDVTDLVTCVVGPGTRHILGIVRYSRQSVHSTHVAAGHIAALKRFAQRLAGLPWGSRVCTILLLRREHQRLFLRAPPPRETPCGHVSMPVPLKGGCAPVLPPYVCAVSDHVAELEVSCRDVIERQQHMLWYAVSLRMREVMGRAMLHDDHRAGFYAISCEYHSNRIVLTRREVEAWEVLERRNLWYRHHFRRSVTIAAQPLLRREQEARHRIRMVEEHQRASMIYLPATVRAATPPSTRPSALVQTPVHHQVEFEPRSSSPKAQGGKGGKTVVLHRECVVYENFLILDGRYVRAATALAADPALLPRLPSWSDAMGNPLPSVHLFELPFPNGVEGHAWVWEGEWRPESDEYRLNVGGGETTEAWSPTIHQSTAGASAARRRRWVRTCALHRKKPVDDSTLSAVMGEGAVTAPATVRGAIALSRKTQATKRSPFR